jgi:hypothetical protein
MLRRTFERQIPPDLEPVKKRRTASTGISAASGVQSIVFNDQSFSF